jgi:hypothetical protein
VRAYYTAKHWLKLARWRVRRARTALRWGAETLDAAPVVLGNAMPKSGSHLLSQVLRGLVRVGPFVDAGFPPINRFEDNTNLPEEAVMANLARLRPGDIRYGYLHVREPFVGALTRPGMASIFVYRDPRDVIVSHVFYATEMYADHGMHRYYTEVLDTMEQRIAAAITGVDEPGFELSGIRTKFDSYLGWLEQPGVLCMRFEALILERDAALTRLLDFLAERGFEPQMPRSRAVAALGEAVAPHRSGTFRKGQPGNWREHFTEVNKALFKEATGDLLVRLGYEEGEDW